MSAVLPRVTDQKTDAIKVLVPEQFCDICHFSRQMPLCQVRLRKLWLCCLGAITSSHL